jgi:hypothetical protein
MIKTVGHQMLSLISLLILSACGDYNMSRVATNQERACLNVVRRYSNSFEIPNGMLEEYRARALIFADNYSLSGAVSFLPTIVESKNPIGNYGYYITLKDNTLLIHCRYAERTDTSIAIAKDNEHFASRFIQTHEIDCPQLIRK